MKSPKPSYIDVLCIGLATYDLIFEINHQPKPDEKMFAKDFWGCGGGPAANAAITTAKFGLATAFIGYLGSDPFGRLHVQELNHAGVITDFISCGLDPTPIAVILVNPDGKRPIISYTKRSKPLYSSCFSLQNLIPKVILVDGHEPLISDMIVKQAKILKIPTILDAGSVHEGTINLVHKVDYVIATEKFATQWTGFSNISDALNALQQLNSNTAITLGNKGVVWKTNHKKGHIPPIKIKARDTTGAGDIFHGTFAGCLAKNLPWEICLQISNISAGLSCQYIGGRTSVPAIQEFNQSLRQHNLNPWI